MKIKAPLSSAEIRELLPHRYPFLLVDRVEKIVVSKTTPIGDKIVAYKAVTQNEPFFQGHFPHYPVMPGVLIVEAMAQVAGLHLYLTYEWSRKKNHYLYLTGVDGARFRAPVEPGSLLRFEGHAVKIRQEKFCVYEAKAFLDSSDSLVAEATISSVFAEKTEGGKK
ncbi:MAG: 3-hydroxyacyl-ACP dehydratase FabZ [Deltaproteobacteria bacterium]